MDYSKTEEFYKKAGIKYSRPAKYEAELGWNLMTKDSVTGEYYKIIEEVDLETEDGIVTGTKKVMIEPFDAVYQIKRVFNINNKREYLVTERMRYAGNAYHIKQWHPFSEIEMYVESKFSVETVPHPTIQGQTIQKRTGNTVTINRYTMPFSRENLEKLIELASENVVLYCKEDGRGKIPIQIPNYLDFRDKSFDELFYKPHGQAQAMTAEVPGKSAETSMAHEVATNPQELDRPITENLPGQDV